MAKRSLPEEPAAFYQVPAALLAFRAADGRLCCLPANWLGMVCEAPAILSTGFRPVDSVMADLRLLDEFVINLPPQELLQRADFRRNLAMAAGELSGVRGISLCEAAAEGMPLIAECPVRIECRKTGLRTSYGQGLLRGEIVAVHLGDRRYGRGQGVDLGRLNPLGFVCSASQSRRSGSLPSRRRRH